MSSLLSSLRQAKILPPNISNAEDEARGRESGTRWIFSGRESEGVEVEKCCVSIFADVSSPKIVCFK